MNLLLRAAVVIVTLCACGDTSPATDGGPGDAMNAEAGPRIDVSASVMCVGVTCGPGELCRMFFGGQDAAANFADGGVPPTPMDECVPLPAECIATECDINGPPCAPCVEALCSGRGTSFLMGRRLGCGGA